MKHKHKIITKVTSILLALALVVSGITFRPATAQAAGWLDYADQTITLGVAVNNSIKQGDYRGLTESIPNYSDGKFVYWHIYKFSMPKDGLLNLYIESASSEYLTYYNWQSLDAFDGFIIFPASNPDDIAWRSMWGQNEIKREYSASRAMYYGTTEIAMRQGDYYFAVRQYDTDNTPYSLTLSYKEPTIYINSITLSPSSLTLEPGEQRVVSATVLPNNATDQTIVWSSSDSSVATVDNGMVTAVSAGTATIAASSSDGEITAECAITVLAKQDEPSPTPSPTIKPTTEPTVEPTVRPTVEPTIQPTVEPTIDPTPEPTEAPTEEPEISPTPGPVATEEPSGDITDDNHWFDDEDEGEFDDDIFNNGDDDDNDESDSKENDGSQNASEFYNVEWNVASATLQVGKSTAKVKATSDNDKIVEYITSNAAVATVNNKGVITGKSAGDAIIRAITEHGCMADVRIKVQKKAVTTKKLTVKSRNIRLKVGKIYSLNTQITPITSSQRITYKSSKPKVAAVNSKGQIKAKKAGKAVITVRSGKKVIKVKVIAKK